jgi:hypothetical protein
MPASERMPWPCALPAAFSMGLTGMVRFCKW